MLSFVLGQPGPGKNGLSTSSACGGRPLSGHHLGGLATMGRGLPAVGHGLPTVGRGLATVGLGLPAVGCPQWAGQGLLRKSKYFHCTRGFDYLAGPTVLVPSYKLSELLGVLKSCSVF